MKKALITFSVFFTVICYALAYVAANYELLPISKKFGMLSPKSTQTSKVTPVSSKKQVLRGLKIDKESVALAISKVPDTKIADSKSNSTNPKKNESNKEEIIVDLWGSATQIVSINEGGVYDNTNNTIVFPGSEEQTNQLFTGANSSNNYEWYAVKGQTYTFSGQLSSDGTAKVYPCIVYADNSNKLLIASNTSVVLDESNNFKSEFSINASNISENRPLIVAFIVEGSTAATTITSTNNQFFYAYTSSVAQKWTKETDLIGLGLNEYYSDNAYTVMCDDGVTTLGLYYDGNLFVTGINTTASEVTFPKNITINGSVEQIDNFGFENSMDWSGAPSLNILHIESVSQVFVDFGKSPITDLYIGSECYFGEAYGNSNIYLHIPYDGNKWNYTDMGFKRILVGDETPDYPVSNHSDWVIAGEDEGEYFGISLLNSTYHITEIFTTKDSVCIPVSTPAADGHYYIRSFGSDDNYGSGTLCKNARNLKTVTIPESYRYIYVSWNNNPITDLYMMGDIPSTYWTLPTKMSVYVANQAYYSNYENNSNWNNASILPDGWEFEWITVNVGRKGEFAQTYIEMTDADWKVGIYVKITGSLNTTDLENIKNLTNLRKLDLSEAVFDALPNSFLNNKNSLIEVTLPETLSSISTSAFRYCSRLSKVIASGVTYVGDNAFYECSKLVEFDISNITVIKQNAFYGCNIFNPSELSSELNSLGSNAFYNTAIREVLIPNTLKSIGTSVFARCSLLTKVILPPSVNSIEASAFEGCIQLVDINLPEGITKIGNNAFYGCNKITQISIPSTLQSIGYGVFSGCTSLVSVKCKAIVPPIANSNFTSNIDLNHCTLYIAPFAIDAYRAAQYWNDFYIMKPLDEPVKNIYVNRPMTFDLLSEDNAVLQENPNMTLDYGYTSNYGYAVGQLSASGDGTLSAGVFKILHCFQRRYNSNGTDYRTTLLNNAENMRADSVLCSIEFEKNRWHFISFQYDVQMEDIFGLNNTDFVIRQYNSTNRASGDGSSSNWETVPNNGTLKAGKGYIIQAANNSKDSNGNTYDAIVRFPSRNTVTKNKLFTSNNVIVPLEEYPAEFAHNRSWNLVGNPYPCYYDMHYLMDDFTTPIVLWRGTNYQAYSPIDDDIILRPNEAFFVQRPLDVEQMVFGAEGRMHYDEAYNANTTPGIYGTSALSKEKSNRSVFNFTIKGEDSDDRARIVINENAKMDYEMDKDATKFFAEISEGAEIYVDGTVKYDICERPLENGTAILGTRIGTSGEYTISLSGHNIENWTVILTDTETGVSTNLCESSYSFDAETGTSTGRFILTFKAQDQSSINDVNISSEENTNVRVINTAGVTIYEGNLEDFKATALKGVYVVVNSKTPYKIVVK